MRYREAFIAGALALVIVGSAGFMAAYIFHANNQVEGSALGAALLGFAAAAAGWGAWIIRPARVVDHIDDYPSDRASREGTVQELASSQAEVSRKGILVKLLFAALGTFGLAALFPFRSWGPAPDGTLFRTKWKRGDRLVREHGEIMTRDALNVDSVVTVFPEGAPGDAASQTILLRLPDGIGHSVDGYVAFSKICTHAGCPVALYRAQAHELMCPCHQSIFDVLAGGKVVSGPASQALPELPITIDSRGYLRATGGYPGAVGPGFWDRA
ncbi:MAG: Rieske (2Fe-2S) protein [Candidatus Eremiobacteraeota bacterium]|nr:Rieske (2Fe-2S) protein [Candidatus Eremiobacteraeota bacterium]